MTPWHRLSFRANFLWYASEITLNLVQPSTQINQSKKEFIGYKFSNGFCLLESKKPINSLGMPNRPKNSLLLS